MTVLYAKPAMSIRDRRGRALAGAVAAALAVGIALAILFATGGDSAPATSTLTPLAPDTGVVPGTAQLEPGDSLPPVGGGGATMLAGGPGISVADALASILSGPLLVNGAVLIVDEAARLCSALAESFPPQCGGDSIAVVGLDTATMSLESAGNVHWTTGQVQLLGFVRDGVLVIDDASLAAGGGAEPLPGRAE